MVDARVQVVFIAGNGRSGSTLLDVLLGQLDGFVAVGELRRIWDRGLIENRPCGCGVPFRSCDLWAAVFREAYGGFDGVDAHQMVTYREGFTQTKHLPAMLLRARGRRPAPAAWAEFLSALDALYRAIARVTGCRVIVDASKWPMYAYLLDQLPALELSILHLIRDPRAAAFSWTRAKEYEPGTLLPYQSPLKTTAYWLAWNPAIIRLWRRPDRRYRVLPYERFIAAPQRELGEIVRFAGQAERRLPFIDPHTVQLGPTHAVAGNIARLTRGPVQLQLDDEWTRRMPRMSRLLVSALTWPWRRRYGYDGAAVP